MKQEYVITRMANNSDHDYYDSSMLPLDYVFYTESTDQGQHVEICNVSDWEAIVSIEKSSFTDKDIDLLIKEFNQVKGDKDGKK